MLLQSILRAAGTVTCLGRVTTVDRHAGNMHELGFPPVSTNILANVSVSISITSESVVNYQSPVAEYGVIWRTILCPRNKPELPSYEDAVSGIASTNIS